MRADIFPSFRNCSSGILKIPLKKLPRILSISMFVNSFPVGSHSGFEHLALYDANLQRSIVILGGMICVWPVDTVFAMCGCDNCANVL